MRMGIVFRVDDPERFAFVANAVGAEFEAPNRPNPGVWHSERLTSLVVATAEDARPGVQAVTDDARFDYAVREVRGRYGPAAVDVSADGQMATFAAGGIDLVVQRSGPRAIRYDPNDRHRYQIFRDLFDRERDSILEAMERVGASNPRFAGPGLAELPMGCRIWTMIIDAPAAADISSVQAALDRVGMPNWTFAVRRSADVDPHLLRRIDARALEF